MPIPCGTKMIKAPRTLLSATDVLFGVPRVTRAGWLARSHGCDWCCDPVARPIAQIRNLA